MVILLDTGYLFSLYNVEDKNHVEVKNSYEKLLNGEFGIPIIMDYVFDELVTLIQSRTSRNDIATEIGTAILSDCENFIQFARVDKTVFSKGWERFKNQTGRKFLSFTDCILLKFAEINRINIIATLDKQFKSWVTTIP